MSCTRDITLSNLPAPYRYSHKIDRERSHGSCISQGAPGGYTFGWADGGQIRGYPSVSVSRGEWVEWAAHRDYGGKEGN